MVALAIVLGMLRLGGQVVEPKDGSLSGKVVNSATGLPIDGVDLALAPIGGGARMTTTADAQGKFTFDRVKLGRYTVQASKAATRGRATARPHLATRGAC